MLEKEDVFLIGRAALDTRTRQLRFDGTAVDVQPRVFDLLVYLIRHRDRVVSKDELFDKIWPSTVVSDASLSQTIKRARDLFRQQGFEADIIRTVARKGYRFDHEVECAAAEIVGDTTGAARAEEANARGTPDSKRWFAFAAISTAVVLLLAVLYSIQGGVSPAPPESFTESRTDADTSAEATIEVEETPAPASSLAVLPFANLTPDGNFVYFTEGLTETLINNLATVRGLRVIARSSAFSAGSSGETLPAIGRQLGVAHVLQGAVQKAGDELRISARLVRARDGAQLWSHQYNRLLDDIFVVQDAIAVSVVAQLSQLLTLDLSAPRPTAIAENAETARAYRLVLEGRRARRGGSQEAIDRAEALFREALTLAPGFPDALINLSEVIRYRGVTGSKPRDEAFREALELATQAAQRAPENGRAFMQLAELQHRHFWDFTAAQQGYERALQLMPGSAEIHSAYSRFLSKAGDFPRAAEEAHLAVDLNPSSLNALTNLILRLIRAQDLDGARRSIDRLKALDPEHIDIPWLETNWHIRNGSYRDALQWITLEELDYLRLSLSAVALHHLGRTAQAEAALAELIETDADGSAFQIAETYAQWGDRSQSFTWLERALQTGDPGLAELYSSVNLEALWEDARFQPFAERVGLPPAPSLKRK